MSAAVATSQGRLAAAVASFGSTCIRAHQCAGCARACLRWWKDLPEERLASRALTATARSAQRPNIPSRRQGAIRKWEVGSGKWDEAGWVTYWWREDVRRNG